MKFQQDTVEEKKNWFHNSSTKIVLRTYVINLADLKSSSTVWFYHTVRYVWNSLGPHAFRMHSKSSIDCK